MKLPKRSSQRFRNVDDGEENSRSFPTVRRNARSTFTLSPTVPAKVNNCWKSRRTFVPKILAIEQLHVLIKIGDISVTVTQCPISVVIPKKFNRPPVI